MQLTVIHGRQQHTIALDDTALLKDLQEAVRSATQVDVAAQKLVVRGRQVQSAAPETPLDQLLQGQTKLMLIGTPQIDVAAIKAGEEERRRKHEAFLYHSQHRATARPVRSTTIRTINDSDSTDTYKFHNIVPFPPEIPAIEARKKMLDRLATDEAVRHVMQKHKFVVGTLTELHPHVNPDLLGLNKNAGESIHLRLLTDDLSGTRAYLDVRKVLLHELSHNVFGPHDNNFKELNSLLNSEVVAYEDKHGIKSGATADAWEPTNQDEEKRTARRLNEEYEPSATSLLKFNLEDEIDERRETLRKAAEKRQNAR